LKYTSGLAETLRSELLLYSIDVHIYFPATIYTPGYIEENKTKPKVTLKIEESDAGLQPEESAKKLLRGWSTTSISYIVAQPVSGQAFRTGGSIYPLI
jgi:hypothetical protein